MASEAAVGRRAFVRYLCEGSLPEVRVLPSRDSDSTPVVTVIIPTVDGNRGGNLARLLAQIDRQTYQKFEVIVVEGDKRQGRAINIAAAIARGEILLTMDDDTRLGHDDLLQKIVAVFATDSTIGIAGVSNLVPADAPWVVRKAMFELPRRSSALVDRVTDSDMAEHPCLAIRKKTFYRVGGEHELLPRGLDPYLRREVRRSGYRVVVIPEAWIHHLLPSTLGGILRQYFRNGMVAAYIKKYYPEFVIEQAENHTQEVRDTSSFMQRILRYGTRFGQALLSGKWIYVGTLVAYAAGFAWGAVTTRRKSL